MSTKSGLNFISLFAGGGGLHLGLKVAGFRPLLATDIESSSRDTFRRNDPDLPFIQADIRHLTREAILKACNNQPVDVIAGGPPCQGFSTLGDQLLGDPRNQLFWHYLKIVKWLSPLCFVIENVNYLRTQYGGKFERDIRAACEALGYRVYVETLNAADYGVPQIRKRVFFVATRAGAHFEWPKATFSADNRIGTKPYRTVAESIGDLPADDDPRIANHTVLRHSERVVQRYLLVPEGGRMPPPQELPQHIRRKNFGNTYKRLDRHKPSLTLVPGNNAFPIHPTLHRSLTPRDVKRHPELIPWRH